MLKITSQELGSTQSLLFGLDSILFGLLLAATLVEVVDDHPNEHVDNKEAHHKQIEDVKDCHVLVVVLGWLHVHADGVNALVHVFGPAVLGRYDEEGEEGLQNVVVVFE